MRDILLRMCAAGALAEIARVGHAPLGEDDPIELRFANGAEFNLDVGAMEATDLEIGEGPYIERAFGHLRQEDAAAFAAIERDWTREPLDLPWAIGQALSAPRRLAMTQPYRLDVGYVFACGDRELALIGESDVILAAQLNDPELESFALQADAPV